MSINYSTGNLLECIYSLHQNKTFYNIHQPFFQNNRHYIYSSLLDNFFPANKNIFLALHLHMEFINVISCHTENIYRSQNKCTNRWLLFLQLCSQSKTALQNDPQKLYLILLSFLRVITFHYNKILNQRNMAQTFTEYICIQSHYIFNNSTSKKQLPFFSVQ